MSTESFTFNVKQWLGDDAILSMDWDVRGMHIHLMSIAWQKTPPGVLPDDASLLCKWLHITNLQDWNHRIQPQLTQAWRVQDGFWHQDGLIREAERQTLNSQKRRAAAQVRWKKDEPSDISVAPPLSDQNLPDGLLTTTGEPVLIETSGFQLNALLKESSIFREESTLSEKTTIWTLGISLLKHSAFNERQVRAYLGKMIQLHGEKKVAEALASLSIKKMSPADGRSYLMGILQSEDKLRRRRGQVAL